jgi:hypothetical protein
VGLVFALYVPGLPSLLAYSVSEKGGKNIGSQWLGLVFLKDLLMLLSNTNLLGFAIVAAAVFLAGLVRLFKVWRAFASLYLLAGGLALLAVAVLRIFIFVRFLSFLIPFFLLALSLGLGWIAGELKKRSKGTPENKLQIALASLICLALAVSLGQYYEYGKQGYKDAAIYLQESYPDRRVLLYGVAAAEMKLYFPEAPPFPKWLPSPEKLKGKFVLAGNKEYWNKQDAEALEKYCRLEKLWPGFGLKENAVYLYRCF